MFKHLTLLFFFLFNLSCQNQTKLIEKHVPLDNEIYINVVEKKINLNGIINGDYGANLLKLLKNWIDNDIKTNGFDGLLLIDLVSISSSEILIENGIRIEMDLEIDFTITKTALDKKTIFKFRGKEFSEINGDFTINDREIQINNISKRMIERLSIKLLQEIN